MEEKLLAWDHNTDSDYRMSVTFIQSVRFIDNEFEQICGGDRSQVDAYFRKQCCMETCFLIKEDNVKHKGLKGSDAFRAIDNYVQLEFRMGTLWDLIE